MNPKQVTRQTFNFGTLGREILRKLDSDNDAKCIIQGANSQTGIGKTTLAVQLCRFVDDAWDPQEHGAYWDWYEYVNDYNEFRIPASSAVLLDEFEAMADKRRSMSHGNLELSQAWARLRNRNVLNIATLPTTSMLDSRLLELADYWILVRSRGIAQPYQINVNDFTHKISRRPFDGDEHIQFRDLPDDDEDYQHIEEMKTKVGNEDFDYVKRDVAEDMAERAADEARQDQRNAMMKQMYQSDLFSLSQRDLAEFVDLTPSRTNEILNA